MAVQVLKSLVFLNLLLLIAPINAADPNRKLDETPSPGTGDPNDKCTPCYQTPPPPPPVYPPPPPPPDIVVYYSPPPPKKKEPKCPPPPSPSFIYITGPPGELYPIDQNYSKAGRRIVAVGGLPAMIGFALLGLLAV